VLFAVLLRAVLLPASHSPGHLNLYPDVTPITGRHHGEHVPLVAAGSRHPALKAARPGGRGAPVPLRPPAAASRVGGARGRARALQEQRRGGARAMRDRAARARAARAVLRRVLPECAGRFGGDAGVERRAAASDWLIAASTAAEAAAAEAAAAEAAAAAACRVVA